MKLSPLVTSRCVSTGTSMQKVAYTDGNRPQKRRSWLSPIPDAFCILADMHVLEALKWLPLHGQSEPKKVLAAANHNALYALTVCLMVSISFAWHQPLSLRSCRTTLSTR